MKKSITIILMLLCIAAKSYSQDTLHVNDDKHKPKAVYQVGAAKVTVWENQGKNGTWKNFKVEKTYKKDDKWFTTSSFNEKELMELKTAIDKAIADESVKVKTTEGEK